MKKYVKYGLAAAGVIVVMNVVVKNKAKIRAYAEAISSKLRAKEKAVADSAAPPVPGEQ